MATLETLEIQFRAQMGNLQTQLNGVKNQLSHVSTGATRAASAVRGLATMAKAFVSLYIVRQLWTIGKQSIQMATDVHESEQLFYESMKGMSDSARDWSENLADSLGLNQYELRKSVGMFNVMFKSMGFGQEKAYEMSTSLTELASDMASFYNITDQEAFAKLRSGMTGMSIPLKELGIILDENILKQYALREGIIDRDRAMTASEKVLARYAAIMGQTKDAQGDLARTIESPANQIRILTNTLNMVKVSLGQAFQPIQTSVVAILNTLARAALTAAQALKTFLWALTGFTGVGIKAAKTAGAGAGATGDLNDALKDSADAYKKAGGAAKKAAKDAKVGLKAFDEINKITEENAAAAKGGGGGIGIDDEDEEDANALADALAAVEAFASRAAEWVKKLWDLALPTREAFGRLWEQMKEFGNIAWSGIEWLYNNVLVPLGEWALTSGLPAFLDTLAAAWGSLNAILESAGRVFEGFYNDILVPLGEWTGQAIIDALGWLKDRFNDFTEWAKNNQETFDRLIATIGTIAGVIIGVWATSLLLNAVRAAFDLVALAISALTNPVTLIMIGIVALALAIIWCIQEWDNIKAKAQEVWDNLVASWVMMGDWWRDNVIYPIRDLFIGLWDTVSTWAQIGWNWVASIWEKAKTWWADNITGPIMQAFNDLIGGIQKAWDDFLTWLGLRPAKASASFTTVTTVVTKQITNPVTGATTTKITGLAKGGVFTPNKPFVGILGDQRYGKNIETPEGLMRDIFRDEIYRFALADASRREMSVASFEPTSGAGGIVQQAIEGVLDRLNITLNVDGQTFGKVSIDAINATQRHTGRILLEM